MRNRARNRKEQEKEAERNFTFYAEGGPEDVFVGLPQEYKSAAAERKPDDPRWFEPDWTCGNPGCGFSNLAIRSKCRNCGVSRSLTPKPLCHQDPCNDPECRLDHEGREIQIFDGDLSRYWER